MNLQLQAASKRVVIFIISFLILVSIKLQAQTTWEFSGTPYAYQLQHFDSATAVVMSKLGIQMHSFGSPYNHIDTTFVKVFATDTNYHVLMFGNYNPIIPTQVNLTNRVFIESATGVPDTAFFYNSWNSLKSTYTDYMVMQGHAYAWTTADKQNQFQTIVNFLIAQGVKFTTPYEYYKYLTDLSIPRTNKVQVILKLDDLRATTSYFLPCFPAYDFLVSKKIKAGFGVNNMWNLTQAQIDTLNHYLRQTDSTGSPLFEIWNHGLDHSETIVNSSGNWSDSTIWPSSQVPGSGDDVVIPAGSTVTIDIANAVCHSLTVDGTLQTSTSTATSLTVNGDLLIETGGVFTSPYLTGATANIIHTMTVYGDFTNAGGQFDFRTGSAGTTMRVINTTFAGTDNSTITVGTYSPGNNDFNSITINKTGEAKVICGSDVVVDQGASTCPSQLIFTSGMIKTGSYIFNALSTTSTDVTGYSSTSYVSGSLGRGMSNSVGKSNVFPIGDDKGYRPITIKSTTGGTQSGHSVKVSCIDGNANTGSSVFTNNIDTVSSVRYYKFNYYRGLNLGADTMYFSQFSPSYGTDDGVVPGNTNLRVAYSTNNRQTWNGMDQTTTHTTSLTSPPTTITPTALATAIAVISDTSTVYISLAKVAGTENNPLPVELSAFTASENYGTIKLDWKSETENNCASYNVERANVNSANQGSLNWVEIATIKGAGTSNSPKQYSYSDNKCGTGKFSYRLKITDLSGEFKYSNSIETTIETPKNYSLLQNYPNPFNPISTIKYELPLLSNVKITVIDILGRQVQQLKDGIESAGVHEVTFNATNLASGVYYYTISANSVDGKTNYKDVKKMILLK